MKLNQYEIARRLHRKGWADAKEYKQALDALGKCTEDELDYIEAYGQREASKLVSEQFHKK